MAFITAEFDNETGNMVSCKVERKGHTKRYCPFCGRYYKEHPAISRKDNKTEICSECGIEEALKALEDFERRNNA